jgi:hypothetical protein
MLVKSNVVMLPTNEEIKIGNIIQCSNPHSSRVKGWKNKLSTAAYNENEYSGDEWKPRHLYILSNENPNDGDKVIPDEPYNDAVWEFRKAPCPLPYWGNENACKKIIASTDKSLKLPEPSNSFIGKYTSEYNKENIISEVMVEYQDDWKDNTKLIMESYGDNPNNFPYIPQLKINSKDNTITIKRIKNSWNTKEIKEKFHEFSKVFVANTETAYKQKEINDWLDENLYN